MNEISTNEQFDHLTEEVRAIIAQKRFEAGIALLEMRHEIGKAILDSPLWQFHKKGQGELINRISATVGLKDRSILYCVEFATRYPDFAGFIQEYGDGKLPKWYQIVRKELPSGERDEPEAVSCKHCPEHCP
ncbi:MAG: hypothetical protein KGJ90_04965 [Patescibacteria group bacterium]|nr:hypothetical protein [Patescibacteria group bacterium]